MKRLRTAAIGIASLIFIVILVFFLVGYFKPKASGVFIDTKPISYVYIDNEEVGKTPYKGIREPGEYIIKLVPESFDKPLSTYEARVTLTEGVETVIRREFAETSELSSGEIVSFEKIGSEEVSIAVVSIPQAAQTNIDGIDKSQAPYKETGITIEDHIVTFKLQGYVDRTIRVRPIKGYQLTIISTLAVDDKTTQDKSSVGSEFGLDQARSMIKIISTPTGFLRVRKEPSVLADEVGRVKPGEQYEVFEKDSKSGWVKIKLPKEEDGKEAFGWVSDQYVQKIDDFAKPTATGSASITPSKSS